MISLRGLFVGLLVGLVCVGLVVLPVCGLEVVVSGYDYGASSGAVSLTVVHPSVTAADSAWGQSFRSKFDGANLTVLQVWMYQTSATGGCTAYLIGETGTFGSSSVPTGSVLATSDEVTVTAASAALYNFTFASGYVLDSAVDYCFYIAGSSGDVGSEYFTVDNSVPLSVDPSVGNMFYYDSAGWTAVTTSELCYVLYGSDGDAVSFNLGGDVTIVENTYVTNVTSSPTVNVTTGDVNVGGVTAEFNNTAVTADSVSAGAVTAGDVSAGAVTASSASATITELIVNATVGDNVTMTGDLSLATTAEPEDFEFWFVLVLILGGFALAFIPRVPIVNVLFGLVSLSVCGASLGSVILPFPWYMSLMLLLSAICCLMAAGMRVKSSMG